MLTFFSVAFTIYGAMHLYAFSKVWLVFPHSLWLSVSLLTLGIAMTLSPILLWQISRQDMHGAAMAISWAVYLWMGFLFLFCCTALVFDLCNLLAAISGLKWPLGASVVLLSVTIIALVLMSYGVISARQIQIDEIIISTNKLSPSVGRVTIAQISDLHLGVMLGDKFLQRIIEKLHELKPDIVVATGDVIDGQGDDLNALAQQFLSLQPRMGLYAVTGNHEYFIGLKNALAFLHNAGFTVLRDESAATGGIVLLGVDDKTVPPMGQEIEPASRNMLASFISKDFTVLLKHQPVVDNEIPFDLQLSGHVHGGQIFPFGLLTRMVYGVHTGLTRLADGRLLYVSRGTGTWGPPVRLFAAPEITLITIVNENN